MACASRLKRKMRERQENSCKKKKVSFLLKAIKRRIGAIIQEEAGREKSDTVEPVWGDCGAPKYISSHLLFRGCLSQPDHLGVYAAPEDEGRGRPRPPRRDTGPVTPCDDSVWFAPSLATLGRISPSLFTASIST